MEKIGIITIYFFLPLTHSSFLFYFVCSSVFVCYVLFYLLSFLQTKQNQTKPKNYWYITLSTSTSSRVVLKTSVQSCPVLCCPNAVLLNTVLPYPTAPCPFFWFCFVHGHTMPMLIRAIMSCHSYTSPPFLSPALHSSNVFRQSVVNFEDLRICIF